MPQKLLGIDVGSYSVKAALFDTTFRSFELTDLFESAPLKADDLPPEDKVVVTTEAILRLLEENNIRPSTTVSAIGGRNVSSRVLTLPLPEKQVGKVLPFELESLLPFEMDDLLIDHHTLRSEKNKTKLLAVAVRKNDIAEHLSILRSANLEPAFVGLDSLLLGNIGQMMPEKFTNTYAIVDIGHDKTSVCVVSDQRVQFIRTLFTAGKAITESIRLGLDLTWDQAIEVKHDHGIMELEGNPLKSKDLRRLSGAIKNTTDPLIREIIQTLHAYQAQLKGDEREIKQISRIYLCGGSSQLRNVPEYLAALTSRPVERLEFFPEGHEVSDRLGQRQCVLAQSVSLGLRAAARGANAQHISSINFRKGPFSFAQDLSGVHQKLFFFGRWAAAIFVVALLSVGVQYQNFKHQYREIEQKAVREYRGIVKDAKKYPKTSTHAVRSLKANIQSYREKLKVLTGDLYQMTALGILLEITNNIPSSIAIDTQEISIDRNKITLRANTDSFASVDKIIASLKNYPSFQKIDKGDIKEAPNGSKTFQLLITVEDEQQKEERTTRSRHGRRARK